MSLEAWKGSKLVGGLYGVLLDGVFSGESMFGLETDVSKICFVQIVNELKKLGLGWMDIQMTTPVTESLGGTLISRDLFQERLRIAHSKKSPI
jgi:leucyl/phenylalanyl-tRNA--protein transferase